MIYERRYIQFNDLVFDSSDMISDFDGDLSFKGSSTERSYGHGSYRAFKRPYLFVRERTLSMTITLYLRKIPCDERHHYVRFVHEQLSRPGRLWSIKNGELQWAIAVAENISDNFSNRNDRLIYNVSFVIPGGLWYKADKQKTFLLPWNVCNFMECMGYRTLQPCKTTPDGDCCQECLANKGDPQLAEDCSCCCDDTLTEDMALCYHLDDLGDFLSCHVNYRLVYDCYHAEKFNKDKFLGQKLCADVGCGSSVIAGQIYSETEIPTEDVTVIINGKMKNPWIKINDNINIIEGEYDGTLLIYPNGDVYYQTSEGCNCRKLLDPSVWTVPAGNEYGWTINPGINKVVIYLNDCCQGRSCVWIQHDPIAL